MDVTWRIEPLAGHGAGTTRVTIEHDFRPRIPGFAAFVDRAFTRPIAGRTLATFKALAEAIAADPTVHAGEPVAPRDHAATSPTSGPAETAYVSI